MAREDKTKEELIGEIKLLRERIAEFEKQDNNDQQKVINRFETVIRDSNDAIIIQDLDGRIRAWNRGAELMYGYSEKEALGMNIERFTTPDKIQEQKEFTRRLIAGETVTSFETKRVTKDGHILDVWLTVTKLVEYPADSIISTGRDVTNPVGIALIERNISELKEAKEVLLREQKQFRELFNNMRSGVVVYEAKDNGEDFIFKDINKSGEHFSKVSRDEVIGKSVLQVFPSVKKLGLFEVFQQVWKTGKSQRHPVSLYQDARISQWVENYVYKLPSGEIVAVYDDVTERKQAEEKLEESEIRYREFFTTSRDCVFITSKEGKWIDFNDAALEIFGYDSREELSQATISSLYVSPQDRSALLALIEQQGYIKEYPVQLKRKNGIVIDVLITAALRKKADNSGIEYYGTIRNITERKKVEEELRKRLQELEIFYKASVGREERIIELKKEIAILKKELGK
ncbi:MAG: PAS domain S-box protein [Candidatus Omnitrophota bacterium]